MRLFVAFLAITLAAACDEARSPDAFSGPPAFHDEGYPERLSDWNVIRAERGALRLNAGVTPYELATPLFSDYALKLRTVYLPAGSAADYRNDEVFEFPVGAIITKTFYYVEGADGTVSDAPAPVLDMPTPDLAGSELASLDLTGVRLMETRVLARRADGWVAIPYVWDERQRDATLKRTGAVMPMTLRRDGAPPVDFPYVAPNQNQCRGCHAPNNTTRALSPIGPKARHLNAPSRYAGGRNQLAAWREAGILSASDAQLAAAPANARWTDENAPVAARARAYLDVNCSHCHNDVGPADTSGLDLTPAAAHGPKLGFCKSPIAAGDGTGGRPFDIVPGDPDRSILLFRMETTNPAAMMPELGRALSHDEGVALVRDWILSLGGGCA
ncbi:MAG: hypothetical protein GC152_01970 [Alphaproteobacteria bacterium]|nr:hypothetical protein [Alphaproteobacteria bacterium]